MTVIKHFVEKFCHATTLLLSRLILIYYILRYTNKIFLLFRIADKNWRCRERESENLLARPNRREKPKAEGSVLQMFFLEEI